MRFIQIMEGQKYDEMFNGIYAFMDEKHRDRMISGAVQSAKKVFKRKDRIDWWLRWSRLYTLKNWAKNASPEELEVIDTKYRRALKLPDAAVDAGLLTFGTASFYNEIEHLLSIDAVPIQNYQWQFQTPQQLIDDLTEIEKEWKANRDQMIQYQSEHDEPEVFLHIDKEWAWYDLNTSSCNREAEAMGHCGNGGGNHRDNILSFRKRIVEHDAIFHRPSLTFILDDEGELGEMKGRANEKPAERYHPAIVKLLLDERIKGIKGGGYMPENNFALTDLDQKTQDMLVDQKPFLRDVYTLWDDYWGIKHKKRMNKASPEEEKEIDQILEIFPEKLNNAINGIPFVSLESFDLEKDLAVYETYKSYSDYHNYYNGSVSHIFSLFKPTYGADPLLVRPLMQRHNLSSNEAEGVCAAALRTLRPTIMEHFFPYDVTFIDDIEIILKTDGSIILQGSLDSFIQRWLGPDSEAPRSQEDFMMPDDSSRFAEIVGDLKDESLLFNLLVEFVDDFNIHSINKAFRNINDDLVDLIYEEFEDGARDGAMTRSSYDQRELDL